MSLSRRTFLKLTGVALAAAAVPASAWKAVTAPAPATQVTFKSLPPVGFRYYRVRWAKVQEQPHYWTGWFEGSNEMSGPWEFDPAPPYDVTLYQNGALVSGYSVTADAE